MRQLLERLPANTDAERFVLGSVLLDAEQNWDVVSSRLTAGDFAHEKHRRIFARIEAMRDRGESIGAVTLANDLMVNRVLESVGGVSYIASLTEGLPAIPDISAYVRIVKEASVRRRIIATASQLAAEAASPAPLQEVIEKASSAMLGLAVDLPNAGAIQIAKVLEDYPGGLDAMFREGMGATGIKTGFQRLDEMIGGLTPGSLIILAARPSMGKTALALNIATNIAARPERKNVIFFSLEMDRSSLLFRVLCAMARVDGQRARGGMLNQEERLRLARVSAELDQMGMFIDDSASVTLQAISAKVKQCKAENGGVDLVVVDYLQLLSVADQQNRNLELGVLSRGLKLMAKEFDVPFLVLSQLSRGPESRSDKRPLLSDLRESGNIEQDADVVLMLFREEIYSPDRADLRGLAEVIVRKQRNGPIGTAKLVWLAGPTRFENRIDDEG